ncbi:MAG TPA: endonuclease III [Tepidisphaeraceae bacterium]|jgi:endonuclease-3|nr:endonuclease III [Tepidisphaeraceae bacterium]
MSKIPRISKKIQTRRERVAKVLPLLKQLYPGAKCSLDHCTPLELLVATILSAQCTDDRVNIVTKTLFKKYRSAKDYARVPQEKLEKEIQSTGFYRNKAKSIRAMAQSLLNKHDGKVPQTMEELVDLAGVGRKTANVVLGNAFGQNVGVVVDTHVTRLSNRLDLTDHATDAVKIEQDLMQVVPQADWTIWSHLLIFHGRKICQARKPKCEECPLLPHCPAGKKIIAEREDQ